MATESQIRFTLKAIIAVVTFITLLVVNLTEHDRRSPEQARYEEWLNKVAREFESAEKLLSQAGEDLIPLPALSDIELSVISPDMPTIKYTLRAKAPRSEISPLTDKSEEALEQNAKLFRVLSVLKEAALFNPKPSNGATSDHTIEIQIRSGSESFKTRFTHSSIESNAQAQLLLKLVQLYSHSQPETAFAHNEQNRPNKDMNETH